MAIDLINENDLNQYLIDVVYQGMGLPANFTKENFQDIPYVEANKDGITKAILVQYLKHRIRPYFKENSDVVFLTPLTLSSELPEWAQNKLKTGGEIFTFSSDKIPNDLRDKIVSIRDTLYEDTSNYVRTAIKTAKDTQASDKFDGVKIKLDYLKGNNNLDSFEKALDFSHKWHEEMAIKAEKDNRKPRKDEAFYEHSISDTKEIMQFENGYTVVQLLTEEALDFESDNMGHCVGKGSYDKGVKDGNVQIYSIRDENGEPHVTFEVSNGAINQCKGKGNKPPVKKYIPYIQEFVNKMNLDPKHDTKNMGLVDGIDGKFYNIYDLPDNFECERLDLSGLDLVEIKIPKNLKCKFIDLQECINPPKEIEITGFVRADLSYTDLQDTKIIGMPEELLLMRCKNPPKEVDLTGARYAALSESNLQDTKIIGMPEIFHLRRCKNPPKEIDLTGVEEADLSGSDLQDTKIIGMPESIHLQICKNPPKEIDLTGVIYANLSASDLQGTKIIGIPEIIYLQRCKYPPKEIDLTGVEEADLSESDLQDTKIIGMPEKFFLRKCKNPPKEINLTGVRYANLSEMDLKDTKIIGMSEEINLSGCKNPPKLLNLRDAIGGASMEGFDFSNVEEIILPSLDKYGENNFKWIADVPKHVKVRHSRTESKSAKLKCGAKNNLDLDKLKTEKLLEIVSSAWR